MTPLTAMRGYVETLTMAELQLDAATRQRYMGIVTDETHRLERIIGDLLDLARLEGGGITLRRERVDVAALFERVAARHERELRGTRRIRLVMRVDPGAAFVTGDPDRLEQALQNLAANALRYTPDGEIQYADSAESRDSTRDSGLGVERHPTVRDNGPGIAPDHLPLIFDRFYQGGRGAQGIRRQRSRAVDRQGHRRASRRDDRRHATTAAPCSRSRCRPLIQDGCG